MRTATLAFASSLLSVALAAGPVKCNADNCARALTGSALGGAVKTAHLSDCQSFFRATVTTNPADGSTSINYPTAIPSYASACSGSARFSSACSCAGITSTTVTVTASPTSVTPTPTPTSTSTPTPTPTASDCTSFDEILAGPDQPVRYKQYYSGTGVKENTNNPGNKYQAPITATYTGEKCEAASQAASLAGYANYYSFDLHKLKSSGQWEAVLYFDANQDTSYFNVQSSDVGEVYGYSL